jgi:hypothetical protein
MRPHPAAMEKSSFIDLDITSPAPNP